MLGLSKETQLKVALTPALVYPWSFNFRMTIKGHPNIFNGRTDVGTQETQDVNRGHQGSVSSKEDNVCFGFKKFVLIQILMLDRQSGEGILPLPLDLSGR